MIWFMAGYLVMALMSVGYLKSRWLNQWQVQVLDSHA